MNVSVRLILLNNYLDNNLVNFSFLIVSSFMYLWLKLFFLYFIVEYN